MALDGVQPVGLSDTLVQMAFPTRRMGAGQAVQRAAPVSRHSGDDGASKQAPAAAPLLQAGLHASRPREPGKGLCCDLLA